MLPQDVAEGACGIDHDFGLRLHLLSAFDVARDHAVHHALGVLRESYDPDVVQQRRAVFGGGRNKIDEQS